ncbi:type IV pilus assembly protein PilF [Marinobacter daqiaonensis]|uniref:Type IV pilus assembly protein PilF n=2 Tax=Marinobacter daqiaonensis TaxID=650891 RepID=A0A1I6GLI6_9GAMM|nr:type IV pilus assembly protein PilF [Marinobacter daqiaonensis]
MVCMLMLAALLAGCVTTTDSRFAREADRDEAVDNYVRLATAYLSKGNYDRARNHLDRALELDSSDAAALATKGLLYQAEGEPELAEEAYEKALRSDSGYTRGRVFYGAFLYNNQRYEEAREQFRVASRDTGYEDRASVFYNLGRTNERLGNLEAAAGDYERAVELRRGDSRALLALSRVLADAGDWSMASRYYSRLSQIIQRSPQLRHTPESLLVGVRIARHFGDYNRESSLALLLRNEYPNSEEYRQYKALIADDNG